MFGQGQGAASIVAVVIDNYRGNYSSGARDHVVPKASKTNEGLMSRLIFKKNLTFLLKVKVQFPKSTLLYINLPTQRTLNSI